MPSSTKLKPYIVPPLPSMVRVSALTVKTPSLAKLGSLRWAALLVAGGLLLGRVSGLLREMVIAATFGASRDADLAILAMTLPDLLTSLLVGGAVASVLIPQYHAVAKAHGESVARSLIGQTLVVLTLASLLLMGGLFVTSSWWVPWLGAGFEGAELQTAIWLSQLALLAFPLSVLSAVITTALQINNRLFAAVSGTLVINISAVLALVVLHQQGMGVAVAAWAVVLGALARLVVGWWMAARRGGLTGCFSRSPIRLLDKSLALRYVQALAAIGLVVCFPVIARSFASHIPGESAAISYALKLMDVPVGLASAIIGMVLLPRLSQAVQHGDQAQTRRLLRGATIAVVGLMAFTCVGYFALADVVIGILFEHGRLAGEAAERVAYLSRIAMWASPFAALTSLLTALCHARRNTTAPFVLSLGAFVALIVACAWAQPRWGATGIAVSLLAVHTTLATAHWGLAWRFARAEANSETVQVSLCVESDEQSKKAA